MMEQLIADLKSIGTQAEIAKRANVRQGTVSKFLSGELKRPGYSTVTKFEKVVADHKAALEKAKRKAAKKKSSKPAAKQTATRKAAGK